MKELFSAGIDEIIRGKDGTIILSPEYYEGYDFIRGNCIINPIIERKAFPDKFGFYIREGDSLGEGGNHIPNFIVLVPGWAS